jgi:hypothetical protein
MGNDVSLIKIDIGTVKDGKLEFYINTLSRISLDEKGDHRGATYKQEGPFYVDIEPETETLVY